jgi:hypothetical protein
MVWTACHFFLKDLAIAADDGQGIAQVVGHHGHKLAQLVGALLNLGLQRLREGADLPVGLLQFVRLFGEAGQRTFEAAAVDPGYEGHQVAQDHGRDRSPDYLPGKDFILEGPDRCGKDDEAADQQRAEGGIDEGSPGTQDHARGQDDQGEIVDHGGDIGVPDDAEHQRGKDGQGETGQVENSGGARISLVVEKEREQADEEERAKNGEIGPGRDGRDEHGHKKDHTGDHPCARDDVQKPALPLRFGLGYHRGRRQRR